MKLYDFMKLTETDYDTYDTVYDEGVTVCYIEEDTENDNYDKFCINIMKKAEMEKLNGDILIVNWTKLIKDNMEKFREFSMRHWAFEYEDEDDFIYEWIKEIHMYMAGYVSEDFYDIPVEFVTTLEA